MSLLHAAFDDVASERTGLLARQNAAETHIILFTVSTNSAVGTVCTVMLIWGICTQQPLPVMAKFGMLKYGLCLCAKVCLDQFMLSPTGGKKTLNFTIFQTQAFCSVGHWRHMQKVEHGFKTTNLHLSSGSKFFYSSGFIARSCAQISCSEAKPDITNVTDRQTNQQKLYILVAMAVCEVQALLSLAW